jgi:transcriptional regulator with XRE-family HTH domain
LREARSRLGLTQQQVAGDRYTKAYISALENGLVRPSVAALDYLAERLGTDASQLMANERPGWTRLDADLLLASGRWVEAVDAFRQLLEGVMDKGTQAELLRSEAEALARLDRGTEAVPSASKAVELFEALGRHSDAALASYWLSAGLFYQDNVVEAKAILQAVLGKVRAGLRVEPDFKLRLLMALSSTEARDGHHEIALSYLEEVRALADSLDDRRRATFLFDLAHSYRETGDFEAAMRTGYASLALFAASDTEVEMAKLENELAISHLATGNLKRASELAASSHRRFSELEDRRQLSHVLDTQAQIEGSRGRWAEALRLADEARTTALEIGNVIGQADALLTSGHAHAALGDGDAAERAFSAAAQLYRDGNRPKLLRRVLTEWADLRAAAGDHAGAFALTREALDS